MPVKKNPRPPVVAILGHVDHGKTTLLDYIRKTHIADKEHGGITQRIGAYEIETSFKDYAVNKITFIDTPGHEAFSKLRSRGANAADIALLLIDAKDSLMPQTVESIAHIKAAKIPFIVVLNKVDLPDAKPEKVKIDLMKYEIITEDKGGNVPVIEISAKTGKGVNDLLETILFMSSELEIPDKKGELEAYIIEKRKDRSGVVVSAVIKSGVLKRGDTIYAEDKKAVIRALINDKGKQVAEVHPSMPFEILGFSEMPEVGEKISLEKTEAKIEQAKEKKAFTLESITAAPAEEKKVLSLILKADSQGSLEAISASLSENENLKVILAGIGDVHRSDVFLAKTTKAIIVGFSVGMDNEVKQLAKQEKVIIKTYNIIYELIEQLQEVSRLMMEKEESEKSVKGEAKILASFIIEGEKIFGAKITKGKMNLGDSVELFRDSNLIDKTRIVSLKTRAKTVNEVKKEQECGLIFGPPVDIKVGDVIKSIS